jgi:hypothetical protein
MDDNADFFERIGTQQRKAAQQRAANRPREIAPGVMYVPSEETTSLQPATAEVVQLPQATKLRRWSKADDIFWPATETVPTLTPGFYRFGHQANIGEHLKRTEIALDGLIRLPDTATEKVLAEFQRFWAMREKFESRGYIFKRGYLLHGPAGSGKTSSLMQMSADIIDQHQGIVCQIDHPVLAGMCLSMIRKIEPDRPIVAIMEDLDTLVEHHGENMYLSLLDGEAQVNGICYIATTNYPERLDRRFVDRPSRFDTVQYIGMPSAAARRAYLKVKEPSLTEAELEEWVAQTEGFSVAHLREAVILVKCFDQTLAQAIKRLEAMRVKPKSDDDPDRPIFGIGLRRQE